MKISHTQLVSLIVIIIVISPKLFENTAEITQYVEYDHSLEASAKTQQAASRAPFMMPQAKAENGGLIAIIANTEQYTWFVKIIGPYKSVKDQLGNLDLVAKTLDLSHGDHLHYDIPKRLDKETSLLHARRQF